LVEWVQPFRQGSLRDDRPHGGLGLGLTLADAVARRAGGGLSVERRPGGGSRFVLSLRRHAMTQLRRAA